MGQKPVHGRMGYCPSCRQNELHVRPLPGWIAYSIHYGSLGLARIGIGPWVCTYCGRQRWICSRQSEAAVNYEPPVRQGTIVDDQPESVGNILEHQSLARVSQRRDRYSPKYRFSTVRRIVEGDASISQTVEHLGLTEVDLQAWIREYIERRLASVKNQLNGDLPEPHFRGDDDLTAFEDESSEWITIDGNVEPRSQPRATK